MAGAVDLGGGYQAREVPLQTYLELYARLEDRVFSSVSYQWPEPAALPTALAQLPTHTWLIYGPDQPEPVGWHYARQSDGRSVTMVNTGLLPEHRGRGLYTRLLPHLLAAFRKAGYTLVRSHHHLTNTAVILPKLRAGFFIQGLIHNDHGLMLELVYSVDPVYREAMRVRSGEIRPSGEAARRLGLDEAAPGAPATAAAVALPDAEGEEVDLGDGYTLRPVPSHVAWAVADALEPLAFQTVSFDWGEAARREPPAGQRFAWIVVHGGRVAGWQISRQWDARSAYMVNTALLPEHRGRGIYTRLLPLVMETLRAEGYRVIRSHHHATNNAVLVPKLRAGFVISGLEMDHHGIVVVLSAALDPLYRAYLDVRTGLTRPTGELARRLRLTPQEEPDV
ncbi:GNAT family N-acetyltransferase [Deinococcus sonorensis]|uniref:GNAT family N-acetyltransferase n=2 Tax=Deinococcus sonorensis TaxID=309891 RepID=A0AAU7UAX1_9DEIO